VIDSFAATETVIPRGRPVPDLEAHGVDMAHLWADKGYAKVYTVPAGKAIRQHKHKINHNGILVLGTARLIFQGKVIELIAPATVNLIAHHVHGIEAVTDIVWACVWPDVGGLTDPDKIDHQVIA